MWVVVVDLVEDWLDGLDESSYVQVVAVSCLPNAVPSWEDRWWTRSKGSRHKNMKELRAGSSGRSELRVLFAFDPERSAILLTAGDKRIAGITPTSPLPMSDSTSTFAD